MLAHQPIHEIELGAFLIARTEATMEDYMAFARSSPKTSEPLPAPPVGSDFAHVPLDGVSRDEAERFAEWVSSSGKLARARLCTDREWERAARGADDRRYPNGNALPGAGDACTLATYGGDVERSGPCPVGSYPASRSPFGADDMTGNVWEWVGTPADISQPRVGIIRGAAWVDQGLYLTLANRGLLAGAHRSRSYGVRLCADLAP
jgi:formylglycine-generating enzyme required for sulfatase activity